MTTNITDAFAKIAAEHDCLTVALSFSTYSPDDYQWNVTLHWDGFSRRNLTCASESGATPAVALGKTLAKMKADREPIGDFDSNTVVDFAVAA